MMSLEDQDTNLHQGSGEENSMKRAANFTSRLSSNTALYAYMIIGISMAFFAILSSRVDRFSQIIIVIFAALVFLIGAGSVALKYLSGIQSEKQGSTPISQMTDEIIKTRETLMSLAERITVLLVEGKHTIAELMNKNNANNILINIDQKSSDKVDHNDLIADELVPENLPLKFTPEERAELVKKVEKATIEHRVESLREEMTERKRKTTVRDISELRSNYGTYRQRLLMEIEALTRRGNLSLVIGSMTTVLAVALLLFIVIASQYSEQSTLKQLLFQYIPRVMIAIFVEFFSFFFLKLYQRSLDEIKYYQNEISNIDAKYLAIQSVFAMEEKSLLGTVVDNLAKTERNSRLQKDESTPEIEMAKIETNHYKEIINNLVAVFRKDK